MKKNIFITFGLILIFGALLYYAYFSYGLRVSAVTLHNLGNAAYRQDDLETALEYYSGSLILEEHEDTRFNYILTKELLKLREEMKQEEEGEKKETETESESESMQNSTNESSPGEETRASEEEKSEQESSSKQLGSGGGERGEEYMLNEQQELSEMSQEERNILKQTLQNLEQEQFNNQRYYNKKQGDSEDPFLQMQKRFFGNIYTGGEKDW